MKFLKYLITALFLIGFIAAVTVYIFAKIYLTPRSIETVLEHTLEQNLKREISFEKVDVDLTGGITLHGIRMHRSLAGETQDFFSCTSAHLDIRYLPLVLRKLIISTITCREPILRLRKTGASLPRLTGNRTASQSAPKLDVFVLPKHIRIIDGTAVITDNNGPFEATITGIQLSAEDISLLSPFRFDLTASLRDNEECPIKGSGEINLFKKEGALRLDIAQLPLLYANYFFGRRHLPFQRGAARISSEANYKQGSHLDIESTVDFSDVTMAFTDVPTGHDSGRLPDAAGDSTGAPAQAAYDVRLDHLHPDLTIRMHYDIPTEMWTIKRLEGTVFSSPVSGDGMIYRKGKDRYLNCSISSNKFTVDNVLGSLTQGPAMLSDLSLSGDVELRVNAAGRLGDTIYPTILCRMSKNTLMHPALGNFQPEMQGSISLDKERVSLTRFKIGTPNLSVTLSGNLTDYRRWPPQSNVKVVSSLIDLPALFSGPDSEIMGDIGPFNLGGITSTGPIDLGNVIFLGLRLTDVRGSYRIENNKAVVNDLSGGIQEGRFTLSLTVDLGIKGFEYYLTLDLSSVPLSTAMKLLAPAYRQFVDGTVTGTLALRGNGREPAYFFENLKGDGSFTLADVRIKGLSQLPRITSLANPEKLKDIAFETGGVRLRLRSGIIEVDGSLISPDLEIRPYGEIGLDSYLDMEAPLKISPELLTGGPSIAQYLPREGSWISLPMTIQGTVQEPEIALSEEALQYIVQKTLPRMLMDILSDKKDSPLRKFLDELSRQQQKK